MHNHHSVFIQSCFLLLPYFYAANMYMNYCFYAEKGPYIEKKCAIWTRRDILENGGENKLKVIQIELTK